MPKQLHKQNLEYKKQQLKLSNKLQPLLIRVH